MRGVDLRPHILDFHARLIGLCGNPNGSGNMIGIAGERNRSVSQAIDEFADDGRKCIFRLRH
jgi:hypothetical protein